MFDPIQFKTALDPIIQLFSVLVISGAGTTVATQILKLRFIPVPVTRYPRFTAAVVSVIASLVAAYNSDLNLLLNSGFQLFAFMVGVFIVSAITYNSIVGGAGKNF